MFKEIKLRILQGDPVVHDVRHCVFPEKYRGFPVIENKQCTEGCRKCVEVCPAGAVTLDPVTVDLGKCTFCPACEETCPEKIIHFSGNYRLAATRREDLLIHHPVRSINPEKASQMIRSYFGKSLKLRQVSAGGCNGCELELNALSNVNFDMGRYGIEFTASPRHADGIVVTGPMTRHMANPASICLDAVPDPKLVILFGACPISGGVFQNSKELEREFLNSHPIDLFIPGCPPHPLTFINGLLDYLQKK